MTAGTALFIGLILTVVFLSLGFFIYEWWVSRPKKLTWHCNGYQSGGKPGGFFVLENMTQQQMEREIARRGLIHKFTDTRCSHVFYREKDE